MQSLTFIFTDKLSTLNSHLSNLDGQLRQVFEPHSEVWTIQPLKTLKMSSNTF